MEKDNEVLVDHEVLPDSSVDDHGHHHDDGHHEKPPTWKKYLSYSVTCMFLFLTGVQYVLILPTAYDYIVVKLGGNSNTYGVALAAYSLSALFANLIFGVISDGTVSIKISSSLSILFLGGGSLMYFIGISPWFVILSRFVCGMGTGAGTAYWADLAKNTPEEEKTKIFSIVMLFRQLGIVAGPAFNLLFKAVFISQDEYDLGPFKLNIDSIPGLFMAVVWVLMIVFCFFCYTDLALFIDNDEEEERRKNNQGVVNTAEENMGARPSLMGWDVRPSISQRVVVVGGDDELPIAGRVSIITIRPGRKPTMREYFDALSTPDVLCLQFALFVCGFVQTALESMLPPMSYNYLEWEESQTSLWFLISGVITIAIFLLVSGPLSTRFHDYLLSLFGMGIEILSFPTLIAMGFVCHTCCDRILGRLEPNDPYTMGLMLSGFILNTLGLPFIASCCVSLFSNCIADEYQGLAHGMRRSLSYVGYLLGPLWAGSFVTMLPLSFLAFLGMYILGFGMLLNSKNTLYR